MSNSSLSVSSLDFDTLKQNFKTYLQNQSVLKDYNFEGSNINVLLDVMTYNSHLNSFYLNMVASEMFLDSSQKYDSVASHSKELNYLPISNRSSVAFLDLEFETTGIDGPFTIPKGTRFSGSNSNNSFEFVTNEVNIITSANDTYSISNVEVLEGSFFQDSFIYDSTDETQVLRLSNENIDVNTLTVSVIENNGANTFNYTRAENLLGINKNSQVFFLQPSDNNRYEIVFGNDIFGRRPRNFSIVTADYIVNNGKDSNGISDLSLVDDLGPINSGEVTTVTSTVVTNSADGAFQETIDDVKFRAPRFFATQQRAVASNDYSALVLARFGGALSDVNVYGGQEVEPKQYGKVLLSLKPASGTIAPDFLKNDVLNYLLDYIALPNRVVFVDPDFFYIHVISTVQLNTVTSLKSVSDIDALVTQDILDFGTDTLSKFDNDFRYSKFVTSIDAVDENITSNDTQVRLLSRQTPKVNEKVSFIIKYNNELEARRTLCTGYTHNSVVLTTTQFTFLDDDDNETEFAQIRDDGNGNLEVYKEISGQLVTIKSNIGSINYTTGEVEVDNIKIKGYDQYISFLVNTKNKDVISSQNMILLIDNSNVNVNVIETVK
jgi:hypothetical protein